MARIDALWKDDSGMQQMAHGKLEDLSDGGFCIRIKHPIEVGSKLIVRWQSGEYSGTVVQSRQQGFEYVLGIKRDAPPKPDGK
jgi:hypothetical protein